MLISINDLNMSIQSALMITFRADCFFKSSWLQYQSILHDNTHVLSYINFGLGIDSVTRRQLINKVCGQSYIVYKTCSLLPDFKANTVADTKEIE